MGKMPPFTLDDAQRAADEWGANCGPAAIAAVCGLTLDEVRRHMGDFERKHYTNPTLMWSALRSIGVRWRCPASSQSSERPDIPFTAVTARRIGGPVMSADFLRTAEYRGVPFARIGMAVQVGEWRGVIVGHNASANFDVLFEEGPHKGLTLNCHPNHQMRYFDASGAEVPTDHKRGLS